jgi:hypothetical protein
MRRRSELHTPVVFGLAALFLASGTALLVDLIIRPQWPTLFFLPLIGIGSLLLAFGFWARCHRDAWLAKKSGYFSAAFVGFLVLVVALGVGREQIQVHEMRWAHGAISPFNPDTSVTLKYCSSPDHFIEFSSPELTDFLENSGKSTVEVEFVVTRDFGDLRGYSIRRIGPFVDRNFGDMHGCQGRCEVSPFSASHLTRHCS